MKFRDEKIEGFDGFYWDDHDSGAWDGPLDDWNNSHREVILSLKSRRTVIQAGGNLGLYPCLLSKYFNKVLTFEPDPDNFSVLQKNTEYHALPNVTSWNYALGETNGSIGFRKGPAYNVGMHKVCEQSTDLVSMIKLDSMLAPNDIDLIWLDIEGYEYPALLGALETIRVNTPMIIVENGNHAIERVLSAFGYEEKRKSKMDTVYDLKNRT